MSTPRIAFIGGGNMAASLIGGLRAQGISASAICASDPGADRRDELKTVHGISAFADNAKAIAGAEIIVLAVKPQVIQAVCRDLAAHLQADQLIVSIAAGISCDSLQKWLGNQTPRAIVRCMPNTPSLLRQGVSGLFANGQVSSSQKQQAERLLSAVGVALWLDEEALIDAVTAVSGSGPAYFFLMIEAMTAAGEQLGLPRDIAAKLTVQTAMGAARMACESDVEPAELRRRVTSPNGTTEAAIKAFQAGGFETLVTQAMNAAARRSAELAEQLGN